MCDFIQFYFWLEEDERMQSLNGKISQPEKGPVSSSFNRFFFSFWNTKILIWFEMPKTNTTTAMPCNRNTTTTSISHFVRNCINLQYVFYKYYAFVCMSRGFHLKFVFWNGETSKRTNVMSTHDSFTTNPLNFFLLSFIQRNRVSSARKLRKTQRNDSFVAHIMGEYVWRPDK